MKEIFLVLVIALCLGYLGLKKFGSEAIFEGHKSASCHANVETMTVRDDWMKGLFNRDDTIEYIANWKDCFQLKRGDLVVYRSSPSAEPVVREIVALSDDHFKIEKSKSGQGWTIAINGYTHEVNDTPYVFGTSAPPALKLYEAAHHGELDQSSVLLFSKVAPGDQDSSTLGVLSVHDIIGLIRARKTSP